MIAKVYELFSKLISIPRPSHHEEYVADFVKGRKVIRLA